MTIGLDYWQVASHYPDYFRALAELWRTRGVNRVYIISAVGRDRVGTVRAAIEALRVFHAISYPGAAGVGRMSMNHLPRVGCLVRCVSTSAIASLVSVTPRS